MSTAYASRFEAVFLCLHPKGPQMTQTSAAKYMQKSKQFVSKWVNRYKEVKNVDDFPNRGSVGVVSKKDEKVICYYWRWRRLDLLLMYLHESFQSNKTIFERIFVLSIFIFSQR